MPFPVAVVVVTRNRAASLRITLQRLVALPQRPRVLVVDNGSEDGTAQLVRRDFPQVALLAQARNLGAAARNLACERVDAPYVAFADDDSWWSPGSLALGAALFDRHPRVALLAAKILIGPEQRVDPTCLEMAASPLRAAADLPGRPVLGFIACGALVRRSAFLGAGGFSDRFGIGGEERLLSIDLAAAGWHLCYVDDLVAHHHPSPARDLAARRRREVRNALWTVWLRRRPLGALRRTTQVLRPWFRDAAIREGFYAAARALPQILRERRSVPRELDRQIALIDR